MPCVFEKAYTTAPKPLNPFLLDKDVLTLIKCMYSASTKSDLIKDNIIMISFFGNVSCGTKVLVELSDHAWECI